MHNFLKSATAVLLLGFSTNMYAQEAVTITPKASGSSDVIIRKKGKTTEKLTVVVDGDKVTVNGKPVDTFKGNNIEVYKDSIDSSWAVPSISSLAIPSIETGEWNMFKNNFGRDIKSNKALLGVMTEKTNEGAKITDITSESAADKAGLKEGDIITKLGDEKIADANDLYKAVGKHKPEDKVIITYKRDGKESTATATLQKNKDLRIFGLNSDNHFNLKVVPDVPAFGFYQAKPRMGLQVQDTEDGKGVKVLEVEDETPADKAGLKEDDIITKVNDKDITSVDDLKAAIKGGKEGDTFKVTYLHSGETKTVTVKYPKELKTSNL